MPSSMTRRHDWSVDIVTGLLLSLIATGTGCDLPNKPDGDTKTDDTAAVVDADGDGSPADLDCDDADATRAPGASERCNGLDDDCDGETDEEPIDGESGYLDADGDGHGDPDAPITDCASSTAFSADNLDCDDADAEISPDATEICNDLDDDCDGETDEEAADSQTWYADADGDGYGSPEQMVQGCEAAPGTSSDATDCDDADETRNPASTELCDGIDNDCDAQVDEESIDLDGDGYVDAACTAGDDCDDSDPDVHPDAVESCDGLDQDCDDSTEGEALSCDCTAGSYGGHDYLFCAIDETATDAQAVCADAGLGLAIVTDSGENDFVYAGILAEDYAIQWVLGLNDVATEGTFVWWDGSSPSYLPWAGGEPNDLYGEDSMTIGWYGNSSWNDVPCDVPLPFVCESI